MGPENMSCLQPQGLGLDIIALDGNSQLTLAV